MRACVILGALFACACGSSPAAEPAGAPAPVANGPAPPPSLRSATPRPSSAATRPESPATIFERTRPVLSACYEEGRKATPAMLDGKLTLNASIDAAGKATCAIPTNDTGLTQEVEDCMSTRLLGASFEPGAARSVALPVVVRSGALELGADAGAAATGLESVETHRMPNAFDVLERIMPELQACTGELDRSAASRSILIGARIAVDGATQCALAAETGGTLPPKVSSCVAGVFTRTKFPPPKGGPGLVLVPVLLMRR